jgi:hypothetical protein
MKREQKNYIGKRFELEPTKLTKLVQVMHEKLAGPGDQSDSYVVYMVGAKPVERQTLAEVLALDNSKKHRIVRLRIHSECSAPNGTSPRSEIDVDFGATFKTESGSQTGVSIEVAGESGGWTADTLSEIEQQVERSWVQHGPPMAFILLIILAPLIIILLSTMEPRFEINQTASGLATSMWLTPEDISPYADKLSRREALTEDEQRQILSRQVANVNALYKHYDQIDRGPPVRTTVKSLLAVAAIAVVGLVLIIRGYPAAVFLWGDEESRQKTRERVRARLWPVLLAISLLPVIVQVFWPSLWTAFIKLVDGLY